MSLILTIILIFYAFRLAMRALSSGLRFAWDSIKLFLYLIISILILTVFLFK